MNSALISTLKSEVVKGKGIETTDADWMVVANQLYELRMVIKDLEVKEKTLKHQLIELSEGQSRYNDDFLFQRLEAAGRIDYAKLLKDNPVDVEPYRKDPVISWKLSRL